MDLPIKYSISHWSIRKQAREEYVLRQKGKCYYCGGDLYVRPKQTKSINWKLFPPNFTKHPIHLHHCHETGLTLGAVHAYCNAVLWQYHGE